MPRPAKNTDEKIIKIGVQLTAQSGRAASASDIRKALGNEGRLSRIREIWETHLASEKEQKVDEVPLPDHTLEHIGEAVTTLEQGMHEMVRSLIARMTEQNVRQFALKERDFAMIEAEYTRQIQALENEVSYLSDCVDSYEAAAEEVNSAAPELEQSEAPEPAQAAVAAAAARKSPNRPLKKTPVPRKGARPSPPARKQSPSPKPSAP